MAKVTINLDKAVIGKLAEAQKKALELTTEALKTDIVTSAVVPKQTGELEISHYVDLSKIDMLKTSINVAGPPYARRLYWHPEYNFRTDKNSNAQGKWMQSYLDGENADFAKNAYAIFLKEQSGGVIK